MSMRVSADARSHSPAEHPSAWTTRGPGHDSARTVRGKGGGGGSLMA